MLCTLDIDNHQGDNQALPLVRAKKCEMDLAKTLSEFDAGYNKNLRKMYGMKVHSSCYEICIIDCSTHESVTGKNVRISLSPQ